MEIIKLIIEGFEKHGFWYILQLIVLGLIIGAFVLTFLWVKKKFTKEKQDNNVSVTVNIDHDKADEYEEENTEHSWTELMNHSFFRTVKQMINYEIQHIDIKERLRRAIFRDFLLIKFTVIHDRIKNFITAGNMDSMSSELFHNKLHSLITEIIQDYEALAIKETIPDIVIAKFNGWHRDKAAIVYKFVDDICEADDWYVSNTVKFYSFLNQMTSILDLTLIDARKTLVHLNGELDAVVYKEITSEHKHLKKHHDPNPSGQIKSLEAKDV